MNDLPADYLRSRLKYDPETGVFTWLHCAAMSVQFNARFAGKVTGNRRKDGYVRIVVDGKSRLAHRLAWTLMTGDAPPALIDHRDENPSNNSWRNLRAATKSQNGANQTKSLGTTGVRGVWKPSPGRWVAEFWKDGLKVRVGTFGSLEAAAAARSAAHAAAFGEYAGSARG